jgi:hypothetical protein
VRSLHGDTPVLTHEVQPLRRFKALTIHGVDAPPSGIGGGVGGGGWVGSTLTSGRAGMALWHLAS